MVLIRYLLLVYILSRYDFTGPIGPLFKKLADTHLQLCIIEKVWTNIIDLMITSSDIVCYQIPIDIILHFLDLIEKAITQGLSIGTAKL